MHPNRFDFNLLVPLHALLNEKNVTRAAERIFLSQPAMSSALGKLREYFNDPLLARVGRRMELTPRGLALLGPVAQALRVIQATLGAQPAFDLATLRRKFVAMIPDFVIPWLTPPLLKRITDDAPGVQLELENWSRSGPARVLNGEIDYFVSVDNPRLFGLQSFPQGLASLELRRINWVCAVDKNHPSVGERITREQFLALPHVYVRLLGESHSVEETVYRLQGLKLDVRVTSTNVLEVPFMLAGTRLVALLPDSLAALLAPALPIKILPLPEGIALRGRISMFWHSRNEPDAAHAWLRDCIKAIGRDQ